MHADLILSTTGQLVTCRSGASPKKGAAMSDVGIVSRGAVAIKDGKIVGVGPADAILPEFDSNESISFGDHVICPAFVDPHTHIVFAGDRLDEFEMKIRGTEYLDILKSGGGINSTVKETRAAKFSSLVAESNLRLDKMIEYGTATAEIKTGYGLDTATELTMLSVIETLDEISHADLVPTLLAAHAIPREFRDRPDAYVDLVCSDILPKAWAWYGGSRFAASGVPFFIDVFCEKNAFDLKQTKRIISGASKFGFAIKAHVDEFTNLGGSTFAIQIGAVSIDHLDAISDEEIDLLSKSKTVGVVTPTVNFNLGSCDFAPARKMIDHGCAIAMSTDYNPGSAPCPSQQMTMAIACRYQRLLPAEALNAATINAAWAIGLGERTGSIEIGKNADLLVLDCKDYRQAAFEFGGNLVSSRFKNGKSIETK